MANNEGGKKNIPISTIPTSKLTVILNNFMVNTVNHLNKLSTNVDEQLSEFDKKMNDLEIMTSLFEAKLESLPDEIKSTFPPLQECNLDDVNPVFSINNANPNPPPSGQNANEQEKKEEGQNEGENKENPAEGETKEGENKEEEKKEDENKEEENKEELSPEEDLNKFLEKNSSFQTLFKMLKVGVPIIGVKQKAQLNGFNMDIFNEMVAKAQKVHSNIH
jgi:hypothetical protein